MPIERWLRSSRLALVLYEGDDDEGNPIERRSSYAVQTTAGDEDLHTVGQALASLSQSALVDIELTENSVLMEEPQS